MPESGKWMFLLGCSLAAFAPQAGAAKPYLAVLGPPPLRFSKAPEIPAVEPEEAGEEPEDSNIGTAPDDDAASQPGGTDLTAEGALVGNAGDPSYVNRVSGGPRNWIHDTQPVPLDGMAEVIDPSSAGMSPIVAEQQRVEEEIQDIFVPGNAPVIPRVYVPINPQMFVPPNSVTTPGSSAAYRVVPR